MITSLFDKTLSDLLKKIDKLISRLEVDISGFNCREVLIHNKRIDVLKRNIDTLRKQEKDVREKYIKYEQLIKSNKLILGRMIKFGIALVMFLSIFLALFYVEAIIGFQTISIIIPGFVSRESLPYVSTSMAILIGFISILVSILYGLYRRRSVALSKEYTVVKNKYVDLINRLKILEREYDRTYKFRIMPRVLNLCKCYVELSEFREKIWLLNKILSSVKNCNSIACFNQYLDEVFVLVNKLREVKSLCNTIFTDEYRVFVETMCSDSRENILNNCYIKIIIGFKEYLLAIDSYLSNTYNFIKTKSS